MAPSSLPLPLPFVSVRPCLLAPSLCPFLHLCLRLRCHPAHRFGNSGCLFRVSSYHRSFRPSAAVRLARPAASPVTLPLMSGRRSGYLRRPTHSAVSVRLGRCWSATTLAVGMWPPPFDRRPGSVTVPTVRPVWPTVWRTPSLVVSGRFLCRCRFSSHRTVLSQLVPAVGFVVSFRLPLQPSEHRCYSGRHPSPCPACPSILVILIACPATSFRHLHPVVGCLGHHGCLLQHAFLHTHVIANRTFAHCHFYSRTLT